MTTLYLHGEKQCVTLVSILSLLLCCSRVCCSTQNAAREGERWARIDAAAREEAERWDEIRESGERAKRNKSSVPYNPLTLEYHESADGLKLRYADDLVRYRAAQRAYQLQQKDVSTDYNPISGGSMARPTPPARPPPPEGLEA